MFIALVLGLILGQSTGPQPLESPPQESPPIEVVPSALSVTTLTPMTVVEARTHLRRAYFSVIGLPPNEKALSRLMAQWALETARGKSMWCYNFGGLKATQRGLPLNTRESHGVSERRVTQRFRSYRSAAEGAKDFVFTLSLEFPKAFSALQRGSTRDFVRALVKEGYFTGNPAKYLRAISLLSREFEEPVPSTADG
jgi:hypothetical protein